MDFGLMETQELIKKGARNFLLNECPKTLVKKMIEDDRGHDPILWNKMIDLGWVGIIFPESYGGGGSSFLDFSVLVEEMGRVCLPGPFFSTVILGGYTVFLAGNEGQKREIIPQICSGKLLVTLALTEASESFDPNDIEVRAIKEKGTFSITGTKIFVPDANLADIIICAARTGNSTDTEEGISLFLVDAKAKGVTITNLKTIAGDKQCEVVFDKVIVNENQMLGLMHCGWRTIQSILKIASVVKCLDMLGGEQQVLEMTVDYVKQRVQFGHPIGSFQTIQNYCTQMAVDVETSRVLAYEAAWEIDQNNIASPIISMAKAWVSDAYKRVVSLGHQCHGGMAYMIDHDMHLFLKRAKSSEVAFGDADYQRELVAREMGL